MKASADQERRQLEVKGIVCNRIGEFQYGRTCLSHNYSTEKPSSASSESEFAVRIYMPFAVISLFHVPANSRS